MIHILEIKSDKIIVISNSTNIHKFLLEHKSNEMLMCFNSIVEAIV